MRPPTQIGLEIASRGSDPWPPIIVENNQPTGPYDHLQVIQVDKYVVKHVAAVDERRIRRHPLRSKPRQRDLGSFPQQHRDAIQLCRADHFPARIAKPAVLERIENHVPITANRNQRLADGQRRAAISKADLDDRVGGNPIDSQKVEPALEPFPFRLNRNGGSGLLSF